MRVLLLAHDCDPEGPAPAAAGFHTCRALAGLAEAVVVTHPGNRDALTKRGPGPAEVVYVGAAPGKGLSYLSYLAFERAVWRRFGADLRGRRFDVVHRVTPRSSELPSPLAKWSPVPFVLGPLGVPPTSRGRRGRALAAAGRWLPYRRATFARAAAVLAPLPNAAAAPPAVRPGRALDFPDAGIDPAVFAPPAVCPDRGPMMCLYAGGLGPNDGADVVVSAFACSALLQEHRLLIAGDGPERPRLEHLIREHTLQHCVELLGPQPDDRRAALMRRADVFAYPSAADPCGEPVLEAMACGMACVVVGGGAPGRLVGPGRGVVLPPESHGHLIASFTHALEALAEDREEVLYLGANASQYALAEFSWEAKAKKMLDVYRWVLGQAPAPTAFERPHSARGTPALCIPLA